MEFKLLGTRIYISFLFAALICFMLAFDRTGLLLPLIFAVIAHEMAHLIAMYGLRCAPRDIRLIPGGIKIIRDISYKKHSEEIISAAGPACNILIALIFLIDYFYCRKMSILEISMINFAVAGFNLLPVRGLDGGALISAFIGRKTENPYLGERIVSIISLFIGIFFFFLGVYYAISDSLNLSVFAVSLYLIIAALIKQ